MINPPPPEDLIAELSLFRDRTASLTGLESAAWQDRPAPKEWSLGEVMCHLRDVEQEVHQVRIRAILTEENAFMPGVNADQWAEPRDYCLQDGPSALADYLAARDETIDVLANLPAEAWERQGQHTFFGPTTLQELVFLIVQHDRVHDRQIASLTAPPD